MASLVAAGDGWVDLEAVCVKEALLRAEAVMTSAKAGLMPAETKVAVQALETLENGTERAKVCGAGKVGWLSVKFLSALTRPRAPLVATRGTTDRGVSYLRCFVGAAFRSGPETPLVLVVHGTGYNAGVWLPALEEWHDLAHDRGAGFEVAALEWTGHGRSRRCEGEGVSETRYDLATVGRDDVLDVLDALRGGDEKKKRRAFAVAHSIGAQLVFHAEQHRPGAFDGVCCFEPMVYPAPPPAPKEKQGALSPFIKTTLKRKNGWATKDDALAYFRATAFGTEWEPKVLENYVDHGVFEQDDGTWRLALDPETEACVYLNSGALGGPKAWKRVDEVDCEVHVAAGANSTMSNTFGTPSRDRHVATMKKIAEAVPKPLGDPLPDVSGKYDGKLLVLQDANHNIIQEDSEWTASFIDASLARITDNLDAS